MEVVDPDMAQIASVTQEVVAANQVPEDRHLPRPLQLHQTRVTPQVEVVAAATAAAGATEIMVSLLTMRWEVLPVPAETMEKLLMTLSATAVVAVVAVVATLKAASCIRGTVQFLRSRAIRSPS